MAAKSEVESSSQVPVVLRVKRKRTEDPAETLVVKKFRKLDASTTQNDVTDSSSVFRFVETLSKHDINEVEVLDRIKSEKPVDHSMLVKKNPFSKLSISERQEDRREKKKVSSQGHRFKVVSKHRKLDEPDIPVGNHSEESNGGTTSASELMSELMHVYDVILEDKKLTTSQTDTKSKSVKNDVMVDGSREEGSEGKAEVEEASTITKGTEKEGAITCNSTEMVREKCQISEGADDDYVYDLYYTMDYEGRGAVDLYDWDSIYVHDSRYGIEMFDYDDLLYPTSTATVYDDDDDSNDEDNWRNDYPDEDELHNSHNSSDDEGAHSRHEYRYHDSYDDYIFDEHESSLLQDTSYWSTNGKDDADSFHDWR